MSYSYSDLTPVDLAELTQRGTVTAITKTQEVDEYDTLRFEFEDGDPLYMGHLGDCCESVWLEDVTGDLQDLVGSKIYCVTEESGSYDEDPDDCEYKDWYFYHLSGLNGTITLRWMGSSNGYYSTQVSLFEKK